MSNISIFLSQFICFAVTCEIGKAVPAGTVLLSRVAARQQLGR